MALSIEQPLWTSQNWDMEDVSNGTPTHLEASHLGLGLGTPQVVQSVRRLLRRAKLAA
jgi:hypothetical protein